MIGADGVSERRLQKSVVVQKGVTGSHIGKRSDDGAILYL